MYLRKFSTVLGAEPVKRRTSISPTEVLKRTVGGVAVWAKTVARLRPMRNRERKNMKLFGV